MVQLHRASLVHPSCHSHKMLDLLELTVSRDLIRYMARVVVDAVAYGMDHSSTTNREAAARRGKLRFDPFLIFASNVVRRSEVKVPAMLVSLVYIKRAKEHLFIQSPEWACERVFLGALILANKYVNDWSIKNYHWALCSGVFGRRDVGRIEREFLDVIEWELSVTEADILRYYDHISAFPSKPKSIPAPAPPPASADVYMDAYPWADESDHSPLSSASPTPSPQTPSTLVSPSDQPTCVYSPSYEMSQIPVTVKQASDPKAGQHNHSHNYSILHLFHPNSNKEPIHPRECV